MTRHDTRRGRRRQLFAVERNLTGFGRTGAWFGVDREGVVPDLMIMAKGLASGYVPTGAVVLREPLAQALEKCYLPLRGTFSGHPLACAAALACLAECEERGLIENARRLGGVLLERLHELARPHPRVGDVHGKGLLTCDAVETRPS